ncbi:hypothetical protein ROJ8625_01989 [Roseivivax jejudonensis]|uniref:Uncharacterized protein n=1 Tax=Roseivivax jejudonensis TaxID=1529041 RepID=A0A1X6Z604_9RHOB|nr:hypothetical protein [Roseivivax jejudonensis]SLN41588.1 hypothetical protein ROJ8625_01989 [Roseivivax jejudonensis]
MTRTARRLYLQAYRRWLEADRRWQLTLRHATAFVPDTEMRIVWRTGHAGSRVRRAYEERARAIEALHVARNAYLGAARTQTSTLRRIVLRLPRPV